MSIIFTPYKLTLQLAFFCFFLIQGYDCSCPALECWFVKEKSGLSSIQQKSLLHINTDEQHQPTDTPDQQPSDESPEMTDFYITDGGETLCNPSLQCDCGHENPDCENLQCEINPFSPHPSSLDWAASLTDSANSPIYLQADWFSATVHGLNGLVVSSVMRAPTATKDPNVILSVSSKSVLVQARLGEPTLLDCSMWADPSSPLSGTGFAVEWHYQFKGDGRLVLAYDAKNDRLVGTGEEGATLDFVALHEKGNASLFLREAKARHAGTYICSVFLPYLLAQVSVDLEIVEPPSLSIYPSPLPLSFPGQVVTVQCEASGFIPLSLELGWEYKGPDGNTTTLDTGSVTGHRQDWDGTYSQNTRLDLDVAKLGLGTGGEVVCVAVHPGGTRRAAVALNVIGVSSPSIEDSMAMVGVALVLYGLIKIVSWTFSSSGTDDASRDKKEK